MTQDAVLFLLGGPTARPVFAASGLPDFLEDLPCWVAPEGAFPSGMPPLRPYAPLVARALRVLVRLGIAWPALGDAREDGLAFGADAPGRLDALADALRARGLRVRDVEAGALEPADHQRSRRWIPARDPRLVRGLAAHGAARVTELLARFPGVPYDEVARRLGANGPLLGTFAAYPDDTLARTHLLEAHLSSPAELLEAARDALARFVARDLPRGWGMPAGGAEGAEAVDFFLSEGFSEWGYVARDYEGLSPGTGDTNEVRAALLAEATRGWRPAGGSLDPMIRRVVPEGWVRP